MCSFMALSKRFPTDLGGGVDRDENHIRTLDLAVDVGREEEVATTAFLYHL